MSDPAVTALAAAEHEATVDCLHNEWGIECFLRAQQVIDNLLCDENAARAVAAALLTPEMLAYGIGVVGPVDNADEAAADLAYAAAILAALRGEP